MKIQFYLGSNTEQIRYNLDNMGVTFRRMEIGRKRKKSVMGTYFPTRKETKANEFCIKNNIRKGCGNPCFFKTFNVEKLHFFYVPGFGCVEKFQIV